MTVPDARNFLETLQNLPVPLPEVDIMDIEIPDNYYPNLTVTVFRPTERGCEILPCLMFYHGAGWILGSEHTHNHLVRMLTVGSNCAVVFVNYSRAPKYKYPVQIEQAYAATKYIAERGREYAIDGSNMAICGDSVGGNIAAVVTLLSKHRDFPHIKYQVLLYPVTDANFHNASYQHFAEGPWLTKKAMEWFWDAYLPDKSKRVHPTASPLQTSLEGLSGLPPALIITDENDVLRDEGEAYAHKLMSANVEVTATRYLGTHHDFMMLNALVNTSATKNAIEQVNRKLQEVFYTKIYK
jgi:acetyl esterase